MVAMADRADTADVSDSESYLAEHVRVFNAAVDNGDWNDFVARFADDAVLDFVGPPVGPFVGRNAIYDAYCQSPPDDRIDIDGPATIEADELVVPYRWHTTGATGLMRFTRRDGRIARLVVTFD
jgi:steroid delta-isomerase